MRGRAPLGGRGWNQGESCPLDRIPGADAWMAGSESRRTPPVRPAIAGSRQGLTNFGKSLGAGRESAIATTCGPPTHADHVVKSRATDTQRSKVRRKL
jgi:hypothetical protein